MMLNHRLQAAPYCVIAVYRFTCYDKDVKKTGTGGTAMVLGSKIKALRLKAGVTQDMMAQELGVSPQSVSKWENNVCAPDIGLLPKLSVYLGVTIDELFDMTVDQKLSRIEKMLDYQDELSDAEFNQTISFLEEQLEGYDQAHPDRPAGRIYSFLAAVYHHRALSDGKKVSRYARKAMRLHPDIKQDQWLLQNAEGAAITDWNCRNHHRTIAFYQELVEKHPQIGRNYLELMDNLLLDHRWKEAQSYLERYRHLADRKDFQVPIYEARIALAEHRPDEADRILQQMEKDYPDHPGVLFELAGFAADVCHYEEALRYYEKSYELDPRPRYYDALQGEALIYEIQKKYEEAAHCWERIRKNLEEEWGYTDGAAIWAADAEKQRLLELISKA